YTLGLKEQLIFPEISYDAIDQIRGMDISIVTTANTDEEGRALRPARQAAVQRIGLAGRITDSLPEQCRRQADGAHSGRHIDSVPVQLSVNWIIYAA
ncbi:MAG: hypothetical protein AAFW74_02555, partial [Pseudomonadota bacterium]